jgi:hypothetical protein
MALTLDHIAISGSSRDAARAYVEETLGLKMQSGGAHARFATHNHLMALEDNLYLEAISIDPDAPAQDRARWFGLDDFDGPPRLTNWICACEDIEQVTQRLPQAGEAVALTRGDLAWQMAVPEGGALPFDNCFPALIQWQGRLHPAQMLTQVGARLTQLTVLHPDADQLSDLLGPIIGAVVRFEAGAAGLVAEFDTPHGRRVLT